MSKALTLKEIVNLYVTPNEYDHLMRALDKCLPAEIPKAQKEWLRTLGCDPTNHFSKYTNLEVTEKLSDKRCDACKKPADISKPSLEVSLL